MNYALGSLYTCWVVVWFEAVWYKSVSSIDFIFTTTSLIQQSPTWLPSCYWSNPEKHPHDCPHAIEATLKNTHMIALMLLKQPWKTSTWLPSCYWSNPEKHPHDCPHAIEATLKNTHMIALMLLKQPWKTPTWLPSCYWSNTEKHPHDCPRAIEATLKDGKYLKLVMFTPYCHN